MIDTTLESPEPQYTHASIRRLVILGMSLIQISLMFVPAAFVLPGARLALSWLMAIGMSVMCGRLIPGPRRWWVGVGSLVSIVSVLSIDARLVVFRHGAIGWVWPGITPLLSLALIQLYLMLSARAFTPPPAPQATSTDRLAHRFGGRRSFLVLLVLTLALHTFGLLLRWAYLEHPCSRLDMTRRAQGCAFVPALPQVPSETYKVRLSPSGTRMASIAETEDVPPPSSPLTPEKMEAYSQQLATQPSIISLWNMQDGTLLRTLEQPTNAINIAFSPNDQWVATGSYDRQVRVWKVDDDSLQYTIPDASVATLSADGSLLATTNAGSHVRLWSLRDGTLLRTIPRLTTPENVAEILFSPDGTLLALRGSDEVTLWRVSDGTLQHTLRTRQIYFPDTAPSIAFSPDGEVLATAARWFGNARDRATPVLLWRVMDGTLLHALSVDQAISAERLSEQFHAIDTLAFAPDGMRLVAGVVYGNTTQDEAALIWQVADGALLEHIEPVISTERIDFSADGTALKLYDLNPSNTPRMYTQRIRQAPVK